MEAKAIQQRREHVGLSFIFICGFIFFDLLRANMEAIQQRREQVGLSFIFVSGLELFLGLLTSQLGAQSEQVGLFFVGVLAFFKEPI